MSLNSLWTGLTEILPKWLAKQRPEVVVLVLILCVMLCGIPWAASRVEGHIDRIGTFHQQEKALMIEAFKQAETHYHENRTEDRKLIRDLLRSQGVPVSQSDPDRIASQPFAKLHEALP